MQAQSLVLLKQQTGRKQRGQRRKKGERVEGQETRGRGRDGRGQKRVERHQKRKRETKSERDRHVFLLASVQNTTEQNLDEYYSKIMGIKGDQYGKFCHRT